METTIQRICEFLQLDYEPSMLSWKTDVAKKVPVRESHIHTELFRESASADVSRWQRNMSAVDVLIVEAFIGKALRQKGYARKYARPCGEACEGLKKQCLKSDHC